MKTKLLLFSLFIFLSPKFISAQTLYNVKLGTDNKKITEVQFVFNGNTITQTNGYGSSNAPASRQTNLPVLMNYSKINDGGTIKNLSFFNASGAYVTNNNFTNAATGVGVYNEGNETLTSNGVPAWEAAMQNMVVSRNALNYLFYDGSSNIPAGADFDIYWAKALTNDDNLVVSERNGNTNFNIVPLDINGNVITSARELRFGFTDGAQSSDGNKKYDWNIGYGSLGRNANQPQYFSVIDVELFNTNQPIYGFRIDNNGNADVKFYGLSDNTYDDNPTNPLVPGLKGNVFNDLDKLNDNTVDGAGISSPSGTQLYASLLNSSNSIIATKPINSDGTYEFLNLQANSNYTVVLHTTSTGSSTSNLPANWINTGENQGTSAGNDGTVNGKISVSVGTVLEANVNFGIFKNLGSIGDTIWYDTNNNGVKDVSETGLQGATVTLDPGTPGNTADDLTDVTDANGNYLFESLTSGNYTITADTSTITGGLPVGVTIADLSQTYDNDGTGTANTSAVTLTSGQNDLDQDFGYNALGSIGDTVWYDTDGDGILDAGEPGLQGATVTLDPGTPGNTADDLTTTTDANGNYSFTNLSAGGYTITVDINTVTTGIPAGKTPSDLVQTFDADGLSSPSKSYITLTAGQDNLEQDFAWIVPTGGTTGGNGGGVESESLGDAISKIYVGRKKNSVPTVFVKDNSNVYNKSVLQAKQAYQGKGQTMLDMFPTEMFAGNEANITSPTDILDYTVADEVLSVDFSLNGETKGVVLGIKTSDKIYNHTKASCDRLRGAEILNVQKIEIEGYNFLMQGLKQRNDVVEYAISFATAKNNNDSYYTIQSNWYVNDYTKFNDVYNFQVWSTNPEDTKKLVVAILKNLKSFIPVQQTEIQKFPETYASKIYREKGELIVELRSTEEGNTAEVSMVELYSETANNVKNRINSLSTEIQQSLRLDIADGYEYDALIKVENEVEDAFYHADGNWGLDYDSRYTEIKNYFVWNDFDREYQDDEYTINRNVELQATSDYDYLTVYKSLLPGTISADYSEYNYVAFTAKGSGLMELGLLKSSIEEWTAQYKVMVDLSEEEQTYYVPFDVFTSSASQENLTAEDLTMLTFTFLPVQANTTKLDLEISDVKFTKTAVDEQVVGKIETFENEFMTYPNPSKGNVNLLLFSKVETEAIVTLTDITGKTIYRETVTLTTGKNELDYNFKVKAGIMLLKVASKEINYGTSKIIFR